MSRIFLVAFLSLITGCASVHQYCSTNSDKYLDYDQCYAEESARRRGIARAASQWQAPQQQSYQIPVNRPVNTNCTQYGNQVNCTSY